MSKITKKRSYLVVNDIFHELSEENERLLNELLFANKCLNVFNRFKSFVDLVINKLKANMDSNESQEYEELVKEVEEVSNERPIVTNTYSTSSFALKPSKKKVRIKVEKDSDCETNFFSQSFDSNSADSDRKERTIVPEEEKIISCSVDGCHYRTHLKRNLMNHLNDGHKNGIKPFECEYDSCGKSFFTKQSLNSHTKIAHKFRDKYLEGRHNRHIGKYVCDFFGCNYETKIKKLFINHTNHHKGLRSFVCEFVSCGKTFISEEGLKCHIEYLHENKARHQCEAIGCDYETYNISRFTNHVNIVHKGVRPYACPMCESCFGCERYLKEHIRVVHSSTPNAFKCEFPNCVKTFKDQKYLKMHVKNVHYGLRKTREKTLSCDIPFCQFRGDCEANLKSHKASHSEERPYRCSFEGCFKAFKMKGSLKAHTEECHLGKTFKCEAEGCDLTFTNRTTWKNHINSQHSDRVLTCDWPGCDYTSKLDRNLRKHKLVHKTVAEHACDWPECNKRFKSRAYLVQHMRIHNNDKRFTCGWPGCSYRCAHSGNIHKHRKIHEKKEN